MSAFVNKNQTGLIIALLPKFYKMGKPRKGLNENRKDGRQTRHRKMPPFSVISFWVRK